VKNAAPKADFFRNVLREFEELAIISGFKNQMLACKANHISLSFSAVQMLGCLIPLASS